MKYLLLITSLLFLASCTTIPDSNTQKDTRVMSQAQALYIDVREPSEWQVGHIEGATLVPLGQIEAGNYSKIPKDTPVKLYCRSGRRAGIALDILTKAWYANITNAWGMEQVAWVTIIQ